MKKHKQNEYGIRDAYGWWLQFLGDRTSRQSDKPDIFFSADSANERARQATLRKGNYQIFNLKELSENPIR